MNKLDIFKSISEVVVSIGVSSVVGNAIKISTPADAKTIKKVAIGIGGFVLSSMVADQATKYTSNIIDEVATKVNEIVKK